VFSLFGSKPSFQPPSQVIIVLDKLIELDDKGYLKRRGIIGTPLQFNGLR
jgi:hypothetical protein